MEASEAAAPPYKPVNWDPVAAERVVDLYVILALYRSGDASLLPEIATLVAQAGRILTGPDDELRNAAKVIHAVTARRCFPVDHAGRGK